MFPRLGKNLLFLLSSRCSFSSSSQVQIRPLRIRFQVREFSFSSSPFLSPRRCKRVGEDEYKVKVSVLWDFNTCPVPSNVSYLKVPLSIMGAARINGFIGPIEILAYGNVYQLSDINQKTLYLNGVDIHHIPGGKNGSHRYLKNWISTNPPPTHLFLLSGDRDPDFLHMVRHLSLNNYKILFACPGRADDYLCSASTTTTLDWSSIVKGKYLIEKYFKLDNDTDSSEDLRPEILEKNTTSQNSSSGVLGNNDIANCEFGKAENKHKNPSKKEVDESPYSSSPVDNHLVEEEDSELAVSHFEEPESSEPQQDVGHSGMHGLFSNGSFRWDVVKSFVFTPRGSRLVSKSRSREDLALKLQKYGPPFLRFLTENDILQLVELLIAEKKWLEECLSQTFPFRLTQVV